MLSLICFYSINLLIMSFLKCSTSSLSSLWVCSVWVVPGVCCCVVVVNRSFGSSVIMSASLIDNWRSPPCFKQGEIYYRMWENNPDGDVANVDTYLKKRRGILGIIIIRVTSSCDTPVDTDILSDLTTNQSFWMRMRRILEFTNLLSVLP